MTLHDPCHVVTGLAINDEQMRGALLTAGIEAAGRRFRCCLTDRALHEFRRKRHSLSEPREPSHAHCD